MYDGIPHQVKQRAGDQGIAAENMEKSQHTDFNEDVTNESASVACSSEESASMMWPTLGWKTAKEQNRTV